MVKSIKNLCCVCSGPAEHNIFYRIPAILHANPNEFVYWKKTIAEMIYEISGIYVSIYLCLFSFLSFA